MIKALFASISVALAAVPALAQDDDCALATPIADTGSFPFATIGATDSGLIADCNNQASMASADVWFAWTPTASGNYTLSVCGASYDIVLAAYDACGGTLLACDDGFAIGPGACSGTIFDVALDLPGLVGGTTYLIQLDGWNGATGAGTLDIATGSLTPPNDDCANAMPISGTGSIPFATLSATDSGLIAACNNVTSADTWYAWTPATSDSYELSICGASFDVVLAAYDICGGIELACDDAGGDGVGACSGTAFDVVIRLPFLTGGTTYLLQIDGWDGATGTGELDIATYTPPPNDECANASPIAGLGSFPVDNGQATSEVTASCNFGNTADVWYEWTSAAETDYTFRICGASYDVMMAVWDACGGSELACDDIGGCGSNDIHDVEIDLAGLTPFTTYLIQVDGWAGATGTGVLDISVLGGPSDLGTNYCATSVNSTGQGGLMGATGSDSVSANNLTLTAGPVPDQPGLFFFGPSQVQVPFGNGFLCVGNPIVRINPPSMAVGNLATRVVDLPTFGLMPGTSEFQYWYRDPPAGGELFNLSDGLEIVFVP